MCGVHIVYAGVEFPVDGDPYCTLTQYWAFIEVCSVFFTQYISINNLDFCCCDNTVKQCIGQEP